MAVFFLFFSPFNQTELPPILAGLDKEKSNNLNLKPNSQTKQSAIVEKVVDGDTIHVKIGEKKYKVRLIGIDTPEKNHPQIPVECFAKEASFWLEKKILYKTVLLEKDLSQGDVDRYKRLLRYVYLKDTNINFQIIKEGYGYEYTYNTPYRYQNLFRQAEKIAQLEKKGLWNPQVCNGNQLKKSSSANPHLNR